MCVVQPYDKEDTVWKQVIVFVVDGKVLIMVCLEGSDCSLPLHCGVNGILIA